VVIRHYKHCRAHSPWSLPLSGDRGTSRLSSEALSLRSRVAAMQQEIWGWREQEGLQGRVGGGGLGRVGGWLES